MCWIKRDTLEHMDSRPLKRIDILRHELKALRFILDHYHSGTLDPSLLPPLQDFQSEQGRSIYSAIVNLPDRTMAEITGDLGTGT